MQAHAGLLIVCAWPFGDVTTRQDFSSRQLVPLQLLPFYQKTHSCHLHLNPTCLQAGAWSQRLRACAETGAGVPDFAVLTQEAINNKLQRRSGDWDFFHLLTKLLDACYRYRRPCSDAADATRHIA